MYEKMKSDKELAKEYREQADKIYQRIDEIKIAMALEYSIKAAPLQQRVKLLTEMADELLNDACEIEKCYEN